MTAALVGLAIASTGSAQTPPSEWSFGLGVWESRQFDRTVDGNPEEDRTLDNANLRFGYTTVREYARVSLFGRVGRSVPREGDERNQTDFGLGLAWNQQVSERFGSSLNVNASRNFSRQTLSDLGIVAPNLTSHSANADWTTSYRSSPRTTLSTSVDYEFREIRNARAIPGSQIVLANQPFGNDLSIPVAGPGDGPLVVPDAENDILNILATEGVDVTRTRSHFGSASFGLAHQLSQRTTWGFDVAAGYRTFEMDLQRQGSEATGRLYIQRAVGRSTSLSTSYEIRRSIVLDPATTIQSVFGGLSTSGRKREISLTLFGGVSYYDAQNATSQLTPVANLALSGAFSRSTTGNLTYRRQFSNAVGFGRPLLIDFFGAGLTQELGSRVSVRLEAGTSFSSDPLQPGRDSNAKRGGGALDLRIAGGLTAGTSLFWTETDLSTIFGIPTAAATKTQQKLLSFYVTFGTSWH